MSELSKLPNVGKVLEEHLVAIGIDTPEKLREAGVEETFLRIRAERDPGACVQMLYGIAGAVTGINDKLLPAEKKQELKEFYRKL